MPPLSDYVKRDTNVTALSAAGAGVGTIYNNNSAMLMEIVQLSLITSPTSSGCTCVVKPPTGIMDTSYFAGTGDVANGAPHWLPPGDFLTLTWAGGPASGQGLATYYFKEHFA